MFRSAAEEREVRNKRNAMLHGRCRAANAACQHGMST
ncbi:Protein of unknown function [Pyronema omphalodes CBS 100304]|uniref:Uncharacterized protein n=1 Tax=Pyronema omphalodes (strain CBS 100304) TaxID=1076935 RepID=U4LGV9_PYROM|nr:Protein of unknown function [Pyronema omphalodes CBS 100304]